MTNNPVADLAAREITMIYRNYRGEIAERTVTPLRIWWGTTDWHPEPGWLMTAFDHDKQADRDFALADCQFAALTPVAASETPDACQQEDLVTAVPVAYQVAMSDGRWGTIFHHPDKPLGDHRPLYAHPPAPMTVGAAAQVLLDALKTFEGVPVCHMTEEQTNLFLLDRLALRALSGEKS